MPLLVQLLVLLAARQATASQAMPGQAKTSQDKTGTRPRRDTRRLRLPYTQQKWGQKFSQDLHTDVFHTRSRLGGGSASNSYPYTKMHSVLLKSTYHCDPPRVLRLRVPTAGH